MSEARRPWPGRRILVKVLVAVLIGTVLPIALKAAPASAVLISTPCVGIGQTRNYLPAAVPNGQFICAYKINDHWYDGRRHFFLVGSDRQIYHTWQVCVGCGYANWTSLGGQGFSSVGAHNVTVGGALAVAIIMTGSDGRSRCKAYNVPPRRGQWTPGQTTWDLCTSVS